MPYETSPAQLAANIRRAQAIVLERLLKIVETSEDEREVRLAGAAILRMKVPDLHPEPESLQATTKPRTAQMPSSPNPAPEAPLSPDELACLHHLLPHVRPERFIKKHSPSHWRALLARHPTAQLAA